MMGGPSSGGVWNTSGGRGGYGIVGDDGGGGVVLEAQIQVWDTKGADEYARLRPLRYSGAHAVGICVGIDDKRSMAEIVNKVRFSAVSYSCPFISFHHYIISMPPPT